MAPHESEQEGDADEEDQIDPLALQRARVGGRRLSGSICPEEIMCSDRLLLTCCGGEILISYRAYGFLSTLLALHLMG
uniref:Uncharacterized protein n=1 Tax=Oryza brachyantha TaxID=4533 RepID=J3MT59_ORYBR